MTFYPTYNVYYAQCVTHDCTFSPRHCDAFKESEAISPYILVIANPAEQA
jgi:hypothetical protein